MINILNKKGFTLIELLIYIALAGIASVSMYEIFIINSSANYHNESVAELYQDLRASLNMMVREIRMAGYVGDDGDNSFVGFVSDANDENNTDNNSIRFTMDLTVDQDILDQGEDINYFLRGNSLKRKTINPSETINIAENIIGLTFKYFDENTNEIKSFADEDLKKIRSVEIYIKGETAKADLLMQRKLSKELITRVQIRNAGL